MSQSSIRPSQRASRNPKGALPVRLSLCFRTQKTAKIASEGMYSTHDAKRDEFKGVNSKSTIDSIHEMIDNLVNHANLTFLPNDYCYDPPRHVNSPLFGRVADYTTKDNYKASITANGLFAIKTDEDWHNLVTKKSKPLYKASPPKRGSSTRAKKGTSTSKPQQPKPVVGAYSVELSVLLSKKAKKKRDENSSDNTTKKRGRGNPADPTVLAAKILQIDLHAPLKSEDIDGGRRIKPMSTEKKDITFDFSDHVINESSSASISFDDDSVSSDLK